MRLRPRRARSALSPRAVAFLSYPPALLTCSRPLPNDGPVQELRLLVEAGVSGAFVEQPDLFKR